ncbi:unnamed protein product [Bathycoccus prasinos]
MARTYAPSRVSEIVQLWKSDLGKINKKAAEALADPAEFANLFPNFDEALVMEEDAKKTKMSSKRPSASAYGGEQELAKQMEKSATVAEEQEEQTKNETKEEKEEPAQNAPPTPKSEPPKSPKKEAKKATPPASPKAPPSPSPKKAEKEEEKPTKEVPAPKIPAPKSPKKAAPEPPASPKVASAATPPDDFVDANEEGPAGDEDADEWIDEPTD